MKYLHLVTTSLIMTLALTGCTSASVDTTPPTPPAHTTGTPATITTPTVSIANGETYTLTAAPVTHTIAGQLISMLAYNGSIPGPILRVTQGSTVTIRFINKQTKPDTIHFHGIRMENRSDGVPDITQSAVPPDGTYDYTLTFPDAGIYMYHPHMRTDRGIEAGLYGNVIVAPRDADTYAPVHRELPLLLDDISLADITNSAAVEDETTRYALMGRYGDTLLVNGVTHETIALQKGEVARLYLTNIANTRTLRLTLPGATLKLVGGDNDRHEHETFVTAVTLAPGERATVDAYFPTAGTFTFRHETPERTYDFVTMTVGTTSVTPDYTTAFQTLRAHTDVTASLAPVRTLAATEPTKTLRLSLAMRGMSDMQDMGSMMHHSMAAPLPQTSSSNQKNTDGIEWEDAMPQMNAASDARMLVWQLIDAATGKINLGIDDWQFAHGSFVKIRVINDTNSMHPMQHPLHFHGNRFAVTAVDGKPINNLGWKDTVLIPVGGTIDLVLEASNVGTWIGHCHILEHAESGMVMTYTVTK